jgi:hypothetical protein
MWDGAVSNPLIPNPTASPQTNSTYNVTVTDANGNTGSGSVKVTVGMTLSLNSSAPAIDPGQSVLLGVVAFGGTPPYTLSWSPASSLSDPSSTSPTATPRFTTTYQVTVLDSSATQNVARGSITIQVNLLVSATASPPVIVPGESTQITATVLGGGLPPYTYSWTPTANLIDPTSASTAATPTSTTAYSVTVTDSAQPPQSKPAAPVTVTVQSMGAVVACYTLTQHQSGETVFDASCSRSTVAGVQLVQYEFTQIWNGSPSQPPDACFILTGFPIPQGTNCVSSATPWLYSEFGTPGDLTRVRVVNAFGQDAAASQTVPPPTVP